MSDTQTPPRLAEWLLGRLAAPEWREDILGDLRERFSVPGSRTALWYWTEMLRSLPHLLSIRARQAGAAFTGPDAAVAFTALALVYITEFMIARPCSWPLAVRVLGISPLSVTATCMGAYITLHALTLLIFLSALRSVSSLPGCGRFWSGWTPALVCAAACLPPVWFLISPADNNGIGFRLCQLTAMAVTTILAATLYRSGRTGGAIAASR